MKDDAPIYIWLKQVDKPHQLAGKLTYIHAKKNQSEKYIFEYESNCDSIVSLLALEDKSSYFGRLPPFFEMNLPEGARMQVIMQKYGKLLPENPAHLLSFCGLNGIGSLAYGYKLDEIVPVQIKDVPNHHQFLKQGKKLFHAMFDDLVVNDGISGVQPKLLAFSNDVNKVGLSPIDSRTWIDKEYIIKGDNKDFPHLAEIEFLSMKAAQFSGIPIPEIELSSDQELLLVKRFDFDSQGNPLALEESASLCEKGNNNKYQGAYSEFAEVLNEYSSDPIDDLEIYFRMLVLNNFIKNGDAHHKNFAVIYDPANAFSTVKLSPAYDIVSTIPYIQDDIPALALSYENYTKQWVEEEALIDFGIFYTGLNKTKAGNIIDDVKHGISMALPLMKDIENKNNIDILSKLKKHWIIFE